MSVPKILRNASVHISPIVTPKNVSARMVVDGMYEHIFDPKSSIVQSFKTAGVQAVQDRLDGGTFIVHEDKIVDFRGSNYKGFIHSDEAVKMLSQHVGDENFKSNKRVKGGASHIFGRVYDSADLDIDEIGEGGMFKTQLSYVWSPFHKNINTLYDIERLICANGMRGLTRFFNASIPMVNKWEEHLRIANIQINNRVRDKVRQRLAEMTRERACVADLMLVNDHASGRLLSQHNAQEQRDRLLKICSIVDPLLHLNEVYTDHAMADSNVAAQLPGHLTVFDVWNLATEIDSHTNSDDDSSSRVLQKLVNDLLLNSEKVNTNNRTFRRMMGRTSSGVQSVSGPKLSDESDPNRVFFGKDD